MGREETAESGGGAAVVNKQTEHREGGGGGDFCWLGAAVLPAILVHLGMGVRE